MLNRMKYDRAGEIPLDQLDQNIYSDYSVKGVNDKDKSRRSTIQMGLINQGTQSLKSSGNEHLDEEKGIKFG